MSVINWLSDRLFSDDGYEPPSWVEVVSGEVNCDHDWSDWEPIGELHPVVDPMVYDKAVLAPTIVEGHLILDTIEDQFRRCDECGCFERRASKRGKAAVELSFYVEEGVSLQEAFEVRGDEDDEPDRTIINRSERDDADP